MAANARVLLFVVFFRPWPIRPAHMGSHSQLGWGLALVKGTSSQPCKSGSTESAEWSTVELDGSRMWIAW